MDQNLFSKHLQNLANKKKEKEIILIYIQQRTGFLLEDKEITITKKQIILYISSAMYSKLIQKNIQSILQEKGYTLK